MTLTTINFFLLVHANDMLDYGGKIIEAFRNCTFSSEHLRKSDDAYMLKGVNNLIQKIESMAEKINLSLFEDFFESSSPADFSTCIKS